MFQLPSLVPRPLPDFILQLWRKKSGSGLGMRLSITLRAHKVIISDYSCVVGKHGNILD